MRILLFSSFAFILFSKTIYSQGCCSGGSGSPIAGGTSQGVLSERQMELNTNFQYISTSKFYTGDKPDTNLFRNLMSNYLYFRVAYGVSKNLTMSVESGYFINKTQTELIGKDPKQYQSDGIADLILFPRYTIYSKNEETKRTEITLGLGFKIPLGKHDDSTYTTTNPFTGHRNYITSPPAVQPTNGSHDFIFYGFVYRGYPEKNFRIFMNALYVKKGWNSLGEKFGDYASVGLFAGKTFFKKLGITLQIKGELMRKMQVVEGTNAFYNVDAISTGGRKVLIVPQISYSYKKITVFALSEFPMYQYVNKTQIGSQYQITAGLTYRFMIKKKAVKEKKKPE